MVYEPKALPTWSSILLKFTSRSGRYSHHTKNPIDITVSALQTGAHDHSSELLEHLIAEEISLQVQNIADGLQQERWPSAAKDTTRCGNDWGSCGSFDWLQPRPDQSRAITTRSFAAQPIFCSSDHSDPQRKVRHWIDESNFSLPGLRPIHREIVSNLQKTHGANFLLNLQWSKAAWCCYRFKKDVVLDQPWLSPITGDAHPTSRKTHPSQRIQFLTQRIKSQTRRPPTPTPLKNWAQVKP